MEIFRVPSVDAVILPVFSRHSRSLVNKDNHAFKKLFTQLSSRYQKPFWYHGKCERLGRIIELEAVHLREAIVGNQTWKPYQHSWGHRRLCQ